MNNAWLHGRRLSSAEIWFLLTVLLILIVASVYYYPQISNQPKKSTEESVSLPWGD